MESLYIVKYGNGKTVIVLKKIDRNGTTETTSTYTPKKKSGCCYRCGRNSHYSPNCFAKTHIKGYELD